MVISYIAAQAFEHQLGTQISAIPHLPVLCFDYLLPSTFLCALKHAPKVTPTGLKIIGNCSKNTRTIVRRFFKLWKLSQEGRSLQKMRSRPQYHQNLMHMIYVLHSLALTVHFSLLRHPKCAYGCSREPAERKISIVLICRVKNE